MFVCVVLCCVWVILVVVCVWKEVLSFQARKECVGGCISDVACGSGGLGWGFVFVFWLCLVVGNVIEVD